jgi:hypothetical protein
MSITLTPDVLRKYLREAFFETGTHDGGGVEVALVDQIAALAWGNKGTKEGTKGSGVVLTPETTSNPGPLSCLFLAAGPPQPVGHSA